MEISTTLQIQAALHAKGSSCRQWAMEHGYNPRTVQQCVQWFAPATGRKPKRPLAKEIMAELSETLGVDLVGGDDE